MTCEEMIQSEEYVELLIPVGREPVLIEGCRQPLGDLYETVSVPYSSRFFTGSYTFGYYMIPKLYGLLDVQGMEASGILQVRRQPNLNLTGKGILMGFIDTGIEYAGSIFRKPDGGTRVVAIWDQTVKVSEGKTPEGMQYGREYTQEELDAAVRSSSPYEKVPSRDENGHGTYLASLAAGNELADRSFTGAAPEASIAMVKLRPAKQAIREYYLIGTEAAAFQENDIMAGVIYLEELARKRQQPLIIAIALGTNHGSHNGSLPLARVLNAAGSVNGTIVVVGTGNETARGHHYEGTVDPAQGYDTVEIRVGEQEEETGFCVELWGQSPELFSVSIRSPGGEYIPRVNVRPGKTEFITFLLEHTRIELNYRVAVQETGEFLVFLRIMNPVPGLWRFQVYNDIRLTGKYNMWLPMEKFISPDTVFLNPSAYTTLTSPSDADGIISTGAYQYRDNSIYLHSGRGYRPDGGIRPDLAAPGVEIEAFVPGPDGELRRVSRTGSCAAVSIMAGAAALLMEWAIVLGFRQVMTSRDAAAYFIRGARRSTSLIYPNREWGYGILDMYGVFEQIRSRERV